MKKYSLSIWPIGIALIVAVVFSGCSMLGDAVMGGISSGASKGVEQKAEKEVAPEATQPARGARPVAGPQWNQLMVMQAQIAFAFAFSAGGLWAGQLGYKPGEYTKFEWSEKGEKGVIMERAFLKKLDDGKEWWRVSWHDEEGSWIWEALIDPQTDQMLRMRARDPDGNEGEVPVSGQAVYMAPAELTKESVQGATVGKEKVDTPAGRFQTDHVVYMAATGQGQVEFWLAPEVPGGVVKYLIRQKGADEVWTSVLVEFGKKATTVLSSF